jgi:hypothetical protein
LPQVWSGRAQLLVQRKRRQYCPLGVVLLRHWRPEQREEAVATKFDQAPRIALQHLLNHCEHRLHEAVHRLMP